VSGPAALVLTGDLGMGHHVVSGVVADALEGLGWRTRVLDSMSLLGPGAARVGGWVFHLITGVPSLYDGAYFAHFRPGSRLARSMDWAATTRLVPALAGRLASDPVEVVVSTFATGASAMAKLVSDPAVPAPPAALALCTDVGPHRLWVRDGLDLFCVTSPAAAAAVRRYSPGMPIAVVPSPVRGPFYDAPSRSDARAGLGIAGGDRCVLVMGGGWGLGPMAQTAEILADRGVVVLAVAGRNEQLAQALSEVARRQPRVLPYGFTEEIPTLMAAADLVLTLPGATTCSEARVVGRPLMLLDVMPGHGRDNLQHQLELGRADVCDAEPERLGDCVIAALDRAAPAKRRPPGRDQFREQFAAALAGAGIVAGGPRPSRPQSGYTAVMAGVPEEVH
jgi:processive 1,2-diacylglycerol beta-glucosyltransferase